MKAILKFSTSIFGLILILIGGKSNIIMDGHQRPYLSNTSFYDLFKGAPVVEFDPDQTDLDDGTVGEIAYYPIGGGCLVCEYLEAGGIYEPFDQLFFDVCENTSSDQIYYEFSKSDGDVIHSGKTFLEKQGEENVFGCGITGYGANIPVPEYILQNLGKYYLYVESENGKDLIPVDKQDENLSADESLYFSFVVDVPDEPRFYYREEEQKLYLINFEPKEFVNVYCFHEDPNSNVFRTGPNGRLVVDEFSCGWGGWPPVIVEGAQTGKVHERHMFLVMYRKTWEPCSDCPSSRLDKGDTTKVSNTPPLCNRIRTKPNIDHSKVVDCVDPGTILDVVGGPECNDGFVWWQVEVKDKDVKGWTVEGDDENFWLLPGVMNNYAGDSFEYWSP